MEDYSYLFDDFLCQTDDIDPPNTEPGNFDMYYPTPSLNYYTFKRTTAPPATATATLSVPVPSTSVTTDPMALPNTTVSESTTTTFAPYVSLNSSTGHFGSTMSNTAPFDEPSIQMQSTSNFPNVPNLSNCDFLEEDVDIQTRNEIENIINNNNLSNQRYEQIPASENVASSSGSSSFAGRFIPMDHNQRQEFLQINENKNTQRKMVTAIKTLKNFLINCKNESREPQNIPPVLLDEYLQEFFIGIRKDNKNNNNNSENDTQYQPGSLDGFQTMINRHLRLNNYGHDIITDQIFTKSRECLKAKKKNLKKLGFGNRPNAAEAVDSEEEDELFQSGAFGTENPDSLISALWYMNTMHFGLRGSHEHRQLKWGDVTLQTEPSGRQKLIYNERLTKTRDGSNTRNTRAYAPKSWSNEKDEKKCHVKIYLKVIMKFT